MGKPKTAQIAVIFGMAGMVSASGAAPARADEVTYAIAGKNEKLLLSDSQSLLISASCLTGTTAYRCDAYTALNQASLKELKLPQGEGAPPGPYLCKRASGQVVYYRDEALNETTFCRFNDGSYVSTSSLTVWAQQEGDRTPSATRKDKP